MALCEPVEIINGVCASSSGFHGLEDLAGLAGLALTASAVILAFAYIIGTLFKNNQLIAYVKSELFELFVSGVLVIFIIGLVGSMNNISVGSFLPENMLPENINSGDSVYYVTGQYFLRVNSDMKGWIEMNYVLNMYVDQIASVTPYARPNGVGLVASPMAGLASPIKQLLYNMTVAVSVAFIINQAQYIVYLFALQAFMKYYIPVGLFFRTFTPTRRLGGTLIGIAVTFLFVLPALTIISYSAFYNRESGPLLTFGNMLSQYMTDSDGFLGAMQNFYSNNFSDVSGSVSDLVGSAFGGIGKLFQNLVGSIFLVLMLIPMSVVSVAFTIGFVAPAFNMIILVQAAKQISRSFGEEVDISSLTRMV